MFMFFENSKSSVFYEEKEKTKINIITQFYVPKDDKRYEELCFCLKQNVLNYDIDKIYLLNEKIYTHEELKIDSDKIVQENIERRLKFSDVFNYVEENKIEGYIVVINSDIFLDKSIRKLKTSEISNNKSCYALLRYEYRDENILEDCHLYGSKEFYKKQFQVNKPFSMFIPSEIENMNCEARCDSMDTWIFHSNTILKKKNEIKAFNFYFGTPGCDNKIIYLLKILGYEVFNEPKSIKTYHYHTNMERNYTVKDRLNSPYGLLIPYGFNSKNMMHYLSVPLSEMSKITNDFKQYNFTNSNYDFKDYLTKKLENGQNFIVPRIAGVENNTAFFSLLINNGSIPLNNAERFLRYTTMKNNAGIKITTFESALNYANLYLDAFKNSDLISTWEPWGDVYKYIKNSHDFVVNNFKKNIIWAFVFDIYHYLHNPWTHALKGKKILIISAFVESIKEKIEIRKEIYGVDLFPECSFTFLKPPQTQGNEESEEFIVELEKFQKKIDEMKDEFDVALVSCGGYGNLVCNYIYKINKSAIYVGGVLQMYFGIYGARWLRERKDILNLYMNKYWTRPKEQEKPRSYEKVENSCYW